MIVITFFFNTIVYHVERIISIAIFVHSNIVAHFTKSVGKYFFNSSAVKDVHIILIISSQQKRF